MGSGTPDWARYWRAAGVPVEAMHAHFTAHVYHRHSHESYYQRRYYGVTPGAYRAASQADGTGR